MCRKPRSAPPNTTGTVEVTIGRPATVPMIRSE
jgi:hypothetical protein